MFDKIDNLLLKICQDFPGMAPNDVIAFYSESIAEGPLERSPHSIRTRLNVLENAGLLMLDRTSVKRRVLCYITEAGEEYLEGRVSAQSRGDWAA